MSSKEAGPSRLGAEVAGAKDRTKTPVQPAPVPPSYDGEEQPTAGAVSDDSDDEVADFRMLLPQLIAEKNKNGSGSAGVSGGSIPKRGEKDFEPTGFRGQEKKLEESRRAMEMVIGQERRATSKSLSTAIWYPSLNRAVLDVSKGTMMSTLGVTTRAPVTATDEKEIPSGSTDTIGPKNQVGVWKAGIFHPRYTSRTELLPEEALFLIERGTLDCRTPIKLKDSAEEVLIPLSLQHAFSLMLDRDGCTRERYQTYAYLKRLGYYVQRAEVTEELRAASAAARRKSRETDGDTDAEIPTPSDRIHGKGIVADPDRPLKLVTLWDLLLYIPRRVTQLVGRLAAAIAQIIRRLAVRATSTLRSKRTVGSGVHGRGLLGIGGSRWESYDAVFSRLQIIPSGHDNAIPVRKQLPDSSASRFQPYFYAWRPATQFRKTDPPLPEYRIAIVSARETSLPKLHEFATMFSAVPLPDAEIDDEDEEERKRAQEQKRRNDESYGRGFVQKRQREAAQAARESKASDASNSAVGFGLRQLLAVLLSESQIASMYKLLDAVSLAFQRFAAAFVHLPPGCFLEKKSLHKVHGGPSRIVRKPNPFPPLKAGRRSVILAVVDHGTTSLLRFGEAEFEKWKLMGATQ